MSESAGTTWRAGWYDDPSGRFEMRYHNGETWTADVAVSGERYVDPIAEAPTSGTAGPVDRSSPPIGRRNGLGTGALVLGIIAVTTAWMPYLFPLGAVLAVLAIGFAWAALRRARGVVDGLIRPRGAAIAGLVTGLTAAALVPVGVLLTRSLSDAIDDYRNPAAHETAIDCVVADGRWTAPGSIVNTSDAVASFSVEVWFTRAGTDAVRRRALISFDDVAPGASEPFRLDTRIDLAAVDCRIEEVNVPLPWGLDVFR